MGPELPTRGRRKPVRSESLHCMIRDKVSCGHGRRPQDSPCFDATAEEVHSTACPSRLALCIVSWVQQRSGQSKQDNEIPYFDLSRRWTASSAHLFQDDGCKTELLYNGRKGYNTGWCRAQGRSRGRESGDCESGLCGCCDAVLGCCIVWDTATGDRHAAAPLQRMRTHPAD
jgi:hypothetical protein